MPKKQPEVFTTITLKLDTKKKLARAKFEGEYSSYDEMFTDWLSEGQEVSKKKPTKEKK